MSKAPDPTAGAQRATRLDFVALFVVAFLGLALEICLYHINLIVSAAATSVLIMSYGLLGFGLGAAGWRWLGRRPNAPADTYRLAALAGLFAGPLLLRIFLETFRVQNAMPIFIALIVAPTACAGFFASSLYTSASAQSSALYWVDMSGAAGAVFVAQFLLGAAGGPLNALFILSAVALLPLGLFFVRVLGRSRGAIGVVLGALLLIGALGRSFSGNETRGIPYGYFGTANIATLTEEGQVLPGLSHWDAFSRIDAIEFDAYRLFLINGLTPGVVPKADAGRGLPEVVREHALSNPFLYWKTQRMITVGAGGGLEIPGAKAAGVEDILALEMNPGMIKAVLADEAYGGPLFTEKGVRLIEAEGRSFLTWDMGAEDKVDLILFSLARSEQGTANETFLAEDYLYTKEALSTYLRRLRPGGRLAFVFSDALVLRWVASNIRSILPAGEWPQFTVFTYPERGAYHLDHGFLLLVEPSGFDAARCGRMFAHARKLEPVASPDVCVEVGVPDDFVPVTDDYPYLFYYLNSDAHQILSDALRISAIALGLSLVALVYMTRRSRPLERADHWRGAIYFLTIGVGFMGCEVLLMKMLFPYLGHPSRGLWWVLGPLLLFCGIGSLASRMVTSRTRTTQALLGIVAAALIAGILLPRATWFSYTAGHGTWLRALLCVACVAPIGCVLGMFLPIGLGLFGGAGRVDVVPMLLCINGIAGVFGSYGVEWLSHQVNLSVALALVGLVYATGISLQAMMARGQRRARALEG